MLESLISYFFISGIILLLLISSQILYFSIYRIKTRKTTLGIALAAASSLFTLFFLVLLFALTDSVGSLTMGFAFLAVSFIIHWAYRITRELKIESLYGDKKRFIGKITHNVKQLIAVSGIVAGIISLAMLGMSYIPDAAENYERTGLQGIISIMEYLNLDSFSDQEVEIVKVIDGDTVKIDKSGQYINVRLIGIDAPEQTKNGKAWKDAKVQNMDIEKIVRMGKESTAFLKSILKPGQPIQLETGEEERDTYDRLLGYLWLDENRMLNNLMLQEGYAVPMAIPPNTKYQKQFAESYRKAIKQRKGLWRSSP